MNKILAHTYYRGRVAMHAQLRALGVGADHEVAIQAFTCLAVPEGVMATGAKPVYVDITSDGFNMDPESLRKRISSRTRAIVVQHTFGIPAPMNEILDIAQEHGLPVIEDCCHSLSGAYKGKTLGSMGVSAFYSFEWGKPIVAGIGGAAVANNDRLNSALLAEYSSYRNPGSIRQLKIELQYMAFSVLYRPAWFWPVRSAFQLLARLGAAEGNFNAIDTIEDAAPDFSMKMAPRSVARLTRSISGLDAVTKHSNSISKAYRERIKPNAVIHPGVDDDDSVVFARYPLRVNNKELVLKLAKNANIELAEWYSTPIHPVPLEVGQAVFYEVGSCPNAERRAAETVSLPTHPRVSLAYVQKVASFFDNIESTGLR